MTEIYEVRCNEDSIEGRGRTITVALFSNEGAALLAAKGLGPMGASDGEVRTTIVWDDYAEYIEYEARDKEESLKAHALAKLTNEERAALGL